MLIEYLCELTDKILGSIEKWTQHRYYLPLTLSILCVWIVLSSFPPFYEWKGETAVITHRIQQPLTPIPDALRGSHEEKLAFRLIAPLLAYFLQLRGIGLLALEQVFGILFLWSLMLLTLEMTCDRVLACIVAWGFANIFTAKWGFYDIFFQFDSLGYFFLAAAMLRGFVGSTYLSLLLAAFTDERALIASSLVFLWWRTQELSQSQVSLQNLFLVRRKSLEVLVAWASYFVLRYVLGLVYGLKTGFADISLATLMQNFKFAGILLWASYEFFLIIILLTTLLAVKQKDYVWVTLLWGGVLLVHLVAMLVIDVSRSAAYAYPAIFLCLYYLRAWLIGAEYRRLVFWVAVGCCVFPTLELFREVYWLSPIFPKILKYL